MTMAEEIKALLDSCGTPLVMFIVGLFFPQVKLGNILNAFRTHEAKPKE